MTHRYTSQDELDREQNIYRFDSRTDSPYQIGSDLIEFVGGFQITNYPTNEEAAEDVEATLTANGFKLVDYDGQEESISDYVIRYLES